MTGAAVRRERHSVFGGLPAFPSLPVLLGSVVLIASCAGAPGSEASDEGAGSRDLGSQPRASGVRDERPDGSDRKRSNRGPEGSGPERLTFRVLRSYSHDPELYTQGLLWFEGLLYESTGRYGRSAVVAWDPETGEVRDRADLPVELFGEGLARVGDELVQLTWRNGVALRWSVPLLRSRGEDRYAGEGWGLTFDGEHLVMSDGSDVLTRRDPETFEVVDRIVVTRAGEPVPNLNELEAAEGWIFANVWTTEKIVRIDPGTGVVTAVIDASGLLTEAEARGVDVLNGIAYRPDTGTFLLTGKLWPRLFEGVFVAEGAE